MTDPPAKRPVEPTVNPGSSPPRGAPGSGSSHRGDPPTIRSGSSVRRRDDPFPGLPGPGDRLGSFVIEEPIGAGGMGAVFRAMDLRLDRHVALKLLPPEQARDTEVVQRFYQEARAAARLDHENIARVYSIGHDAQHHYIAFEYIEGQTIRQRVAEHGPLSIAEAINYTLQISSALVHASERSVVHRDIKPSNIIVTPQGRAKLVDMGLARRFERGVQLDDGLTQSGMTLGTFDYISPEQARDPRDVDVRSDLYSLGCTLFHMLTGRPPFPEGTVLQKLLQHQEEPPPDVRTLNPSVPPDLSAILMKLMAKDRDRRYQVPEQLVRDLLTLAGTLGLRSISPEGLIWMSAAPQRAWDHHLMWVVPATALAGVVALLIYWGRLGSEPSSARLTLTPPILAPELPNTSRAGTPSRETPSPDRRNLATSDDHPTTVPASRPREYQIRSGDNLAALLTQVASGSTITLLDNGPFDLDFQSVRSTQLLRKNLVIQAGPQARPVLRAARPVTGSADSGSALLAFGEGRVILDGLEFLLDPGVSDGPNQTLTAILAEQTDLTLHRCLFRLTGNRSTPGQRAAIRLRSALDFGRTGDRPAPTVVEECFFDRGQTALWVQGPADLQIRDCLFGQNESVLWFDNVLASTPVPVYVALKHSSILAGSAPIFRLGQTAATLRLDDVVIAPPPNETTTLVLTDLPDRLEWLGRGNLYARIGTFLQPSIDLPGRPAIRRFDSWAEDPARVREIGSDETESAVWLAENPLRTLAQANPALAFLIDPIELPNPDTGARRGPFGPMPSPSELLASTRTLTSTPVRVGSEDPATPGRIGGDELRGERPNAPSPDMPEPMVVAPMIRAVEPSPAAPTTTSSPTNLTATDPILNETFLGRPRSTPSEPAGVIRSGRELQEALGRANAPMSPIRLSAATEIVVSSFEIIGKGRWMLTGPDDRNAPRPRLRVRPESDLTTVQPSLSTWRTGFRIRSGSLELQNVDLIFDPSGLPAEGRTAAFTLAAGTDLTLDRCTVTGLGLGNAGRSTLIAVLPAETDPMATSGLRSEPMTSSIEVIDSLIRTESDVVDLAGNARLNLELTNTVVGATGSLLHGHGRIHDDPGAGVKFQMRQSFARVAGGLVQLESSPQEPDLPQAEVIVRDSVLATTARGAPLFRVDGQDTLEPLRDRIRWEGHNVAYHQIEVYRRDQSSQPGTVPLHFDRPDWEVAVAPREDSPFHGELRFLKPWDDSRPLASLTLDDVRLEPDSPARASSPDLSRIPPPPSGELKDLTLRSHSPVSSSPNPNEP